MTIEKLLKRKVFRDVLGDNYILSPSQLLEMTKFMESDHAKNSNSYIRIRYFILYNLDNYVSRYEESIRQGRGVSYDKLETCYGKIEADKRWKSYKEKQAKSNTFEYKKQRYGWTEEKFTEFNKSRSITLENLISRHGQHDGILKWNEYCEKQRYTNTLEYFIEKYNSKDIGTSEWLKYNYSKGSSNRIEDIIKRHNLTREEACEYVSKKQPSSNISNSEKIFVNLLFEKLGYDLKYSYKTRQFCIWCEKLESPVFFDVADTEKNVIIEFNGDLWHANPKKYRPEDNIPIVNKKAKEIWEYENKKISSAIDKGFRVIKIWESDFVKNPEQEIKKVIEWLKR